MMDLYDLWFSSVKLPNEIKKQLMVSFCKTEDLWLSISEFKNINDISILKALQAAMNMEKLKEVNEIIIRNDIKTLTIKSSRYPAILKNYDDSPYTLYYFGDIDKLNSYKTVSIVGSRLCTDYGKEVANNVSAELSKYQINVVSGLAKGIDCIAHWGAVKNGGFTTAVLGCGLDKIYPAENRKLYYEIKERGCIISEFLPGTPPLAFNFPIRNRIISGLSDLILVVEAAEKSGSLITASRALDQGKQVMAVPGSVFSNKSKETNRLIKDGAYIFTGIDSILDLIGIKYNQEDKKRNVICDNKEMSRIYNLLSDTPMHVDDIVRITNIDISLLYELLLEMQLEDNIKCIAGNFYVKVNEGF
jgi:DNA processing protein